MLSPFFEEVDSGGPTKIPEDLVDCLSALYRANADADAMTAAWSIMSRPTPDWFNKRLLDLRAAAGRLLEEADDEEIDNILSHPFVADFGRNIRSGFQALRKLYSADEQELIARVRAAYDGWAADPKTWVIGFLMTAKSRMRPMQKSRRAAEFKRMLSLAMLYLSPRDLPLPADISILPARVADGFIGWLVTPPPVPRRRRRGLCRFRRTSADMVRPAV